jgi:cellulose synthase/poly-beta-1,6-N-acetylglucosamine synthase-like glycosyltransferase
LQPLPAGIRQPDDRGLAADHAGTLRQSRIIWRLDIPPAVLYRAQLLSAMWKLPVSRVLIAHGWMCPMAYSRELAHECGVRAANAQTPLRLTAPSACTPPWHQLISREPIALRDGGVVVAGLNAEWFSPAMVGELTASLGDSRKRVTMVPRQTLIDTITHSHGHFLLRRATHGLRRSHPGQSAADGIALWQIAGALGVLGACAGAAAISFRDTLTLVSALLSLVFLITVMLRLIAAGQLVSKALSKRPNPAPNGIPDSELPVYTVLVPLFRETSVLPGLVAALCALDYPPAKLDIKLILESVDTETIAAARAMDMPGCFDIIVVPDGQPRTKPKACNYALEFATGDYVVIFDAEDRPEPDQLRKAVAAFAAAPPDRVCLQARLNFYNASENWLSKQFTIEYTSLFWGVLPALDMLKLPIPLGGTSNHFRIDALRELGGWDAFNVTEDADLGMRIYRAGMTCGMLDSVTYEEAACQPGNWLRQRTRWLKGWMQTYAVHMRRPSALVADLGIRGAVAFHGLFAAVIVATLAHPLVYVLLAYDAFHGGFLRQAESVLGLHFWAIALFNLLAGFGAAVALGVISLRMRGVAGLLPQLLLIPVYWLMISAAAYRALYQLITNPFYWEKTQHGLSRTAPGMPP